MNIINVNTASSYDVKVGAGLLHMLGSETAAITKCGKAVIVSDSNVWPLYGEAAQKSLESAGFIVYSFVFPAGEASKNGTTYLALLNYLASKQVTRSDCLIALGGGVVGDLTGFAAATYLRGISYIQVPTTLLAAVDSSVGGKTAIDLDNGKNLAGAFYQPRLVLCDIDTLSTLPDPIFIDGCAEVIKYAVLYDDALFAHLKEHTKSFDREAVISCCVSLKRDVVAKDEFDRGERMKLNLGHTIGHAVEATSHFTVSHGKAVAIGMAIIARSAASVGICSQETANEIICILTAFGLPCHTDESAETLYQASLSDKKRAGETVNLIIPTQIGSCDIRPTAVEELKTIIKAGL